MVTNQQNESVPAITSEKPTSGSPLRHLLLRDARLYGQAVVFSRHLFLV